MMKSIFAVWVWKDPFKNMKSFFKKQGDPEKWLKEGAVTSDDDAAIIFFDGDDQLGGFDNNPPEDGFKLFKDGRLAVWCLLTQCCFTKTPPDPQISVSETDGMDMPEHMFIIPRDPNEDEGPDLTFMGETNV